MMKELREFEGMVTDLTKRVATLEKLIKEMPAGGPYTKKPPAKKKRVKPTGE